MLQNAPAALRAAGVLVLTGWVGAYLVLSSDTPPRGGDINWAFVLAVVLLIASVVLGSRPVRTRVPVLRPPTYELASVVSRWRKFELRTEHMDADTAVPKDLFDELERVDAETERVVARHFSDWEPVYHHNVVPFAPSDTISEVRQKISARYYRLFWHLDALHGGRDQGVV